MNLANFACFCDFKATAVSYPQARPSLSASMRRKAFLATMTGDHHREPAPRASPEQSQCDNAVHLAKRVYRVANSVARALQPIVHLRNDPKVTGDLVQKVFALVAALSALIDDLMLESVSRDGSQGKDMWSKEHQEKLLAAMEQCHGFFTNICRSVRIADECHHVKGLAAGKKYIDQYHYDDENEVREETENCYRLVSQTRIVVKHTCLTRLGNL